ncbi:uncharacterized protein LOC113319518 [Papaver somniferum]|uniref:uncharacterized protein LOC113319518 n=1 Tax=Papaver somniferum TaxID=3469 RepID=UPI000E6F8F3A|nr:uncharacterized protein LOC113319518 [Papaver somniferum]
MMEMFDNLPKDIILDILTRLPTETVLDSKLVCKPWRDVVHLPPFSQIHLDRLKYAANDSDYEGKYRWYGFGCVVSTNEYKVVRMYESGGDSNVGIIQVYTLGSGIGWRNAGTLDINMKYVRRGNGAFAGEALH